MGRRVETRQTIFATALLLFWNGLRSPTKGWRYWPRAHFNGSRLVYRFPAPVTQKEKA